MKNIVVVDRNPHIRRLVQRELSSEGYNVYTPVSELELIDIAGREDTVDLLIIDPAVINNSYNQSTDNCIIEYFSEVPVIVHSLAVDKDGNIPFRSILGRIEKNWDSIGEIKKMMDVYIKHREH